MNLLRNRDTQVNPTDAEIGDFIDGYGLRHPGLMAEVEDLRLLQSLDLVRWALQQAPTRVSQAVETAAARVQKHLRSL